MSIYIRFLRLWCVLILVAYPAHLVAEDLNLDDLKAPEIPAFAVLGVSPSEVLRPTSPKAFAISIMNDAVRDDGKLATDFAMQVSPYWWKDRPKLTWDKYNGKMSIPDRMTQTLSISVASSQVETKIPPATLDGMEMTRSDNLLSFGISTDLIRAMPSKNMRDAKQLLVASNVTFSTGLAALEVEFAKREDVKNSLGSPRLAQTFNYLGDCPDDKRNWCIEYMQRYEQLRKPYIDGVNRLSNDRVGPSLRLSGAVVYLIPDGDSDKRDRVKTSLWLSYGYVREVNDGASPFQFVGLLRYNDQEAVEGFMEAEESADIGARFIYESKTYPLTASIEYIYRNADSGSDERLTAMMDYQVNENFAVFLSVGENLESNVTPLLTNDDSVINIGVKFNTKSITGQ